MHKHGEISLITPVCTVTNHPLKPDSKKTVSKMTAILHF